MLIIQTKEAKILAFLEKIYITWILRVRHSYFMYIIGTIANITEKKEKMIMLGI